MSRENVELVRCGYDALNEMLRRGEIDVSMIQELWTSDCVLKPAGILPESAEMHGHEAIARFIGNQMEAFERLQVKPLEFVDAGERVVAPIRFGGKARYTGMEVAFSVTHAITLRDGKVARTDVFREKEEALEAVGLRE